ncbi:hypothetical protein CHS0354_016531 [Potamilus streckersoni]|uniref:Uncharacterized protein n=1 Tax=Potamilus streckersoni TaxID=2493646 RepID=A0AAE0WF00_9BIVA|nr:hypothetical protein CHS0354_016531 [Potamilus streckersoni]
MEWRVSVLYVLALLILILQTECISMEETKTDAGGLDDSINLRLNSYDLPAERPEVSYILNGYDEPDDDEDEFQKRSSLFRFGKRRSPFRFGKRSGTLFRFGKRGSIMRFGKKSYDDSYFPIEARMPFRFGKRLDDSDLMDEKRGTLLRFGRSTDKIQKEPHTPFRFGREEDM